MIGNGDTLVRRFLVLTAFALLGSACDSSPSESGDTDTDGGETGTMAQSACDTPGGLVLGVDTGATIEDALASAPTGSVIRVPAGDYPAVLIERDDVSLCGDGARIVSDGAYGIRITGNDVTVQGFSVAGVVEHRDGAGHGPTGVVLSGEDILVRDVVASNNGINGFLVTPTAARVRLEGIEAFDNGFAGVALGGGTGIEIVDATIYKTAGLDEDLGQEYGILTDNIGRTNDEVYVEGIEHVADVTVRRTTIYGHPGYGIRVSAANRALSNVVSERITTRNFNVFDSHLYENGARTDDFVGGLYHQGNVLLQHVEGGEFSGNRVERGYTWGVDAYACNFLTFRNNLFVDNDLGVDTPGVTFNPVGVEINGGHGNVFERNLAYGNGSGFAATFFPDSGDAWDTAVDAYDSFDGTYSVELRGNILLRNDPIFDDPDEGPIPGVDYMRFGPDSVVHVLENNVIGTIPMWQGGDPSVLSADFSALNPLYTASAEEIFEDAEAGDFTIRADGPLAGTDIGPEALHRP